ncbi:MAG: hypothetical protein AAFV07_14880 [Bacteroidota bacterium]
MSGKNLPEDSKTGRDDGSPLRVFHEQIQKPIKEFLKQNGIKAKDLQAEAKEVGWNVTLTTLYSYSRALDKGNRPSIEAVCFLHQIAQKNYKDAAFPFRSFNYVEAITGNRLTQGEVYLQKMNRSLVEQLNVALAEIDRLNEIIEK